MEFLLQNSILRFRYKLFNKILSLSKSLSLLSKTPKAAGHRRSLIVKTLRREAWEGPYDIGEYDKTASTTSLDSSLTGSKEKHLLSALVSLSTRADVWKSFGGKNSTSASLYIE
ncbi:hypothetical protein ENBRE01_1754 [Enteropsectra breve]|nr:hypothetical protein ENBRE01_1754 [Enteropsectra breve]